MMEIINTTEGFDDLKELWQQLEKAPAMRVFQTFSWNRNAWEMMSKSKGDNKLWIACWRSGDGDAVIFPFYIDGEGRLRFIFDTENDLCNAVYQSERNRNLCYRDLVASILEEPLIRSVELVKLDANAEPVRYLGVMLRGAISYKDNAYSWIRIKKGSDKLASMEFMRSKDRSALKSICRKSQKFALKVLSAENGDPYPDGEVDYLREEMCKQGVRDQSFFPVKLREFIKKIYYEGASIIVVLLDSRGPVALNYLLKKDDRLLSWIFLYTDACASTSLYVRYIFESDVNTPYVLDFGLGVYDYKNGTFRPETSGTYCVKYGKTPLCHFGLFWGMCVRMIKDYLKARIQR